MTDAADLAITEDELRRRLDRLSTVAAIDPDGWTRLQDRLQGARAGRRRAVRNPLLVAAAVILIAGALLLTARERADRTITDSPTTTTERTSTTPTSEGRTPTTVPLDPRTGAPAGGPGAPPGGLNGTVDGSGGAGPTPSGSGGTGSPGAPGPGGTLPPTTATPPTTPPPSAPGAQVQFVTTEYTLVGNLSGSPDATMVMSVYRPGRGDRSDWNSPAYPGRNCLSGVNGTFLFPEPGPHAYSWGVVASDVAGVRVVTASGTSVSAVVGVEGLPGLRPWIARRPNEAVDRFEALDAQGSVIATAPATNGFHALTDAC